MLVSVADAKELAPQGEPRLARVLDDLESDAREALQEAELVEGNRSWEEPEEDLDEPLTRELPRDRRSRVGEGGGSAPSPAPEREGRLAAAALRPSGDARPVCDDCAGDRDPEGGWRCGPCDARVCDRCAEPHAAACGGGA